MSPQGDLANLLSIHCTDPLMTNGARAQRRFSKDLSGSYHHVYIAASALISPCMLSRSNRTCFDDFAAVEGTVLNLHAAGGSPGEDREAAVGRIGDGGVGLIVDREQQAMELGALLQVAVAGGADVDPKLEDRAAGRLGPQAVRPVEVEEVEVEVIGGIDAVSKDDVLGVGVFHRIPVQLGLELCRRVDPGGAAGQGVGLRAFRRGDVEGQRCNLSVADLGEG